MIGLLLFSHGSILPAAGVALEAHARRLREAHGFPLVEVGYLNYSEPTFAEAAHRLAAAGARRIVVVPFFLAPGYFVTHSLPKCIASVQPDYPNVEFIPAEPLGEGTALGEALTASAQEALPAGDAAALLVMVHGSPEPRANGPMYEVIERVSPLGNFPIVEVGFMECNEPTIPEAMDRCVRRGAGRIVAVPYFLHLGTHVLEDLPAFLEAGRARYPSVPIYQGDYIGCSERLTPLLAERAKAALERRREYVGKA